MTLFRPPHSSFYAERSLCIDASGHRYRPANEALTHALCERCADVVDLRPEPPPPDSGDGAMTLTTTVLTSTIHPSVDDPPHTINDLPSPEGQKY